VVALTVRRAGVQRRAGERRAYGIGLPDRRFCEPERQSRGAEFVGNDEATGIDGCDRNHEAGEAGASNAAQARRRRPGPAPR
jgi:hypothetical protein